MTTKPGKAVLRASLDDELIEQLKIAAIKAKVQPNVIVDAALRLYLGDPSHLEALKARKSRSYP